MTNALQSFTYDFPAVRGIQAGREYFVVMCPLSVIPKLFRFDDEQLPAEYRAQRVLDRSRVPTIARYISDNPDSYVFSSITASVDGVVEFTPVRPDEPTIGHAHIPMTARFIINDGQHRRAAIEEALSERPELESETISVVLFPDAHLERCQQFFADLNKHAVRPTPSLGILYDHRNDMAGLSRYVVQNVPMFRGLTELERSSMSYTSRKLFTLSAIHQASARFLGKSGKSPVDEGDAEQAVAFWIAISENMPAWSVVRDRRQHAGELRRDQIQTHGLTLKALARAGRALIDAHPVDWAHRLAPLQTIDWDRSNPQWEGRALSGGALSKAHGHVTLTTNFIKSALGLPLDESEQATEDLHAAARKAAPPDLAAG